MSGVNGENHTWDWSITNAPSTDTTSHAASPAVGGIDHPADIRLRGSRQGSTRGPVCGRAGDPGRPWDLHPPQWDGGAGRRGPEFACGLADPGEDRVSRRNGGHHG